MGSSLAVYHYVQSLGKNAQVIVPNERIGALGDKMLTLSRRSPVNIFASEIFNGGGHANASGGEYYGSVAESVQLFFDNYSRYFS